MVVNERFRPQVWVQYNFTHSDEKCMRIVSSIQFPISMRNYVQSLLNLRYLKIFSAQVSSPENQLSLIHVTTKFTFYSSSSYCFIHKDENGGLDYFYTNFGYIVLCNATHLKPFKRIRPNIPLIIYDSHETMVVC